MQSPAPASSLAESSPAASPQLRRWICQQGLRSARIRGLLLVLAAASAAAAALSTTAPQGLPFQVWSHFVQVSSFYGLLFNVYVTSYMGSLILPRVVFIDAPCNAARMCALDCFRGLKWTTIYLNHTYGQLHPIRDRVVILLVWYVREKLLPGMIFLEAVIAYDWSIARGRERLLCGKRQFLYHIRTQGSQTPARQSIRALRQAAVSLKKANPQARTKGSTRGLTKNNPRIMVG